jgi:hypothetical protein
MTRYHRKRGKSPRVVQPLAGKSFDRLLLGSLCAGVATTQFTTELQSVMLEKKVSFAADLEPVEAIKHSTLYQIIVSAFCRTFPIREINVGLAMFLPCLKHELKFLENGIKNNLFDFEPMFNYATTRLGKVQEVNDCVLLVVPEAGTALEWFEQVQVKLGFKVRTACVFVCLFVSECVYIHVFVYILCVCARVYSKISVCLC